MFISPRIPLAKYRNEIIQNDPINLSLCIYISLERLKWYPDNTGLPAISFHFGNGSFVKWVYNSERDRDEDFLAISNNTYGNMDKV